MKLDLEPIYRTHGTRHRIDRCEPQLRAITEGKIKFHALTHGNYPGQSVPAHVLPGIASIGFWDAAGPQDWGLDAHRNEGIEIVFLETGAMVFTVDHKHYDLHAGHFTITRPWQLHKLGAPNIGPGRLHWIILDVEVRRPNQEWCWPRWVLLTPEDLAALTRKLRHNENPVWNSTPVIAQTFRDLAYCITHWDQPTMISRVMILMNQLLLGLLSALAVQQTEENVELTSRRRTVELFLADLEQSPHCTHSSWTLDSMSAHCGMGVTAFSKYCRQIVNSGPVDYLNRCRLEWAARQLKNQPEKSITEIALECGFNSSQYFATRFRNRFHTSPRDYRERKHKG